jgi:hypothetical protein
MKIKQNEKLSLKLIIESYFRFGSLGSKLPLDKEKRACVKSTIVFAPCTRGSTVTMGKFFWMIQGSIQAFMLIAAGLGLRI